MSLSHNYASLNKAKAVIEDVGNAIRAHGLPNELSPMVFIFTGTGNVSRGAQDIFQLLPHEYVSVDQLPNVIKNPDLYRHKLIGCVVTAQDFTTNADGTAINPDLYFTNPEGAKSVFYERIAPFATVIVNGIYWDPRFPRLLTTCEARSLTRLVSICDISCDINVHIITLMCRRDRLNLQSMRVQLISHSSTLIPKRTLFVKSTDMNTYL